MRLSDESSQINQHTKEAVFVLVCNITLPTYLSLVGYQFSLVMFE